MDLLFVLGILVLTIVVPLWLLLHYITKWRSAKALSADDERMLADLWQSAKRMEERVVTLEAILDAEHPQWRRKV